MPCTRPSQYDPSHPHMGCVPGEWCVDDNGTPHTLDGSDRESVRRSLLRLRHLRATGQCYNHSLLVRVERLWDRVK